MEKAGKDINFAKAYGLPVKFPYVTWRIRFWDWLWYRFGAWFWRKAAGNHPAAEVKRRLNWMTLDSRENNARWRNTPEGRAWLIEQAHKNEEQKKLTFAQRYGSSAEKLGY